MNLFKRINLFKNINLLKKSKNIYLIFLGIVVLLGVVIGTTYAKFPSSFVTSSDIVEINLGFDVSITSVQEYHEVTVEPVSVMRFNIQLTNNSSSKAYYGMWYDMIEPNVLPSDGSVEVGWITGTTGPTSGELAGNATTTASIAIVNNTQNKIKVYIGVNGSSVSTADIEYLDGKYLISDEVTDVAARDVTLTYISVDGDTTNGLPDSGVYDMTYRCQKGSILSWDNDTRGLTYEAGSYVEDKCSLFFKTKTEKVLLNTKPIGSYVKYVGKGGTVGNTRVACQTNGPATDSTLAQDAETEAPNSCLGQNAHADLDTSGYTYGYCFRQNYKYYVTGWRIVYYDGTKPVIASAGSPECVGRVASEGNVTFIKTANALALKYCNSKFVDGDCTCTSTTSGQCDIASADAWAINNNDFNKITTAITGTTGGYLFEEIEGATLCGDVYSNEACGYNNDLLDNGSFYWFAAQNTNEGKTTNGVNWNALRFINSGTDTVAIGLRPVISLSSSVYITGGTGTMDDPYVIAND